MSRPIVAVVGRPNVGKSTFFNKIVGREFQLLKTLPGVNTLTVFTLKLNGTGIGFDLIRYWRYRTR